MDWGADRSVLLRLYRSFVRSRLEYGCAVFSSARKSYLKKLEPIQNQSSLQALDGNNCDHLFIQDILKLFNDCCSVNKKVVLAWVPSHVGIKGNEKADELAKQALNFNVLDLKVPYTDLKVNVNSVFKQKWQAQWNACPDNKLFQINPTVGDFYVWTGLSHREEIVITRARIGHTYFTHSYLLKGKDMPWCIPCHCPDTVKHIF